MREHERQPTPTSSPTTDTDQSELLEADLEADLEANLTIETNTDHCSEDDRNGDGEADSDEAEDGDKMTMISAMRKAKAISAPTSSLRLH